ncbi:CPBP family intramembrane glutamic endopeptidase [Nocardioides sp. GXQ0305]|uniref:CPBP family intramembrane glutamic endopeptidase n=1 Tax=Nocardioides sp. GXQ0305 TaxID=3423912 RepID=UPI003D7D59C1
MTDARRLERTPGSRPSVAVRRRRWRLVTVLEVVVAAVAVLLDLWLPTLVLLALAGVSLLVRRRGLGSLGLRRGPRPVLALKMLLLAAVWSVLQLGVVLPVVTRLSGDEQDLSGFGGLEGNVGMLVALLVLSWTLAAFGEELAYRGYLFTRLREAAGDGRVGVLAGVVGSSLLFGLAHAEQGVVGIAVVTVDAVVWSVLRIHYRTLWASILAHGFNNTIGFVTFFLVGPVAPLW